MVLHVMPATNGLHAATHLPSAHVQLAPAPGLQTTGTSWESGWPSLLRSPTRHRNAVVTDPETRPGWFIWANLTALLSASDGLAGRLWAPASAPESSAFHSSWLERRNRPPLMITARVVRIMIRKITNRTSV